MKTYKEQLDKITRDYLTGGIPYSQVEEYADKTKELQDRIRLMRLGGFDQEEVDELTWEEVKESLDNISRK